MLNSLWILASQPQMFRYLCTSSEYDLFLFDLEHSNFLYPDIASCIDIARSHGKSICLRLSCQTKSHILHSIELNPDLIMIPDVSSPSQLSDILDNYTLPPQGSRGFSPYSYSSIVSQQSNFNTTKLCLQLESKLSFDNRDMFKKIDAVDSIFIGRYDLSRSLDCAIDSTLYISMLIDLSQEFRSVGLKVGTVCLSESEYPLFSQNFDFYL